MHRTRASAKLASTQNRFAPGRAAFVSCPQLADASTQNALHYDEGTSGRSFDRETNLNYNYFRDYDPSTGRYVQSDPIGLAGGINLYSYVEGNPVSFIDPLGLDPASGRGFSTQYGNWCGKNWSGGKSGPIISSTPEGPVDSLDSCCMAHDYCYAKLEDKACPLSKGEKKKAFKECDAILASCARALSNNGVDWPSPPRDASNAYFYKQKLQTVFKGSK